MEQTFKAFQVAENQGKFEEKIVNLNMTDLRESDVLIKVSYSSLNYKDALSASGNKGVTRKFPHVPGIDAAGTVVASKCPAFAPGTKVLVTGYDLGMNTWGGFGEYISVPAHWVIALPATLSEKEAMSYGTAGLTAGLSVQQIVDAGITPHDGRIVVSGASGGVGSIAVAILAKLGFSVLVISSKPDEQFFIHTLGAKEIIGREEFIAGYNAKPMAAPEFAGAIDTVSGPILSGMLKAVKYGGTVTCCGMVASPELNTSIFPFILRGVKLMGIDSVQIGNTERKVIWEQLGGDWKVPRIDQFTKEIGMEGLNEELGNIVAGKAKGRVVLAHR